MSPLIFIPCSSHSQGYLNFLQGLEQEAGSLQGVSIQRSHVLFGIGDLAKIKEGAPPHDGG
jgi:hypothetical protein